MPRINSGEPRLPKTPNTTSAPNTATVKPSGAPIPPNPIKAGGISRPTDTWVPTRPGGPTGPIIRPPRPQRPDPWQPPAGALISTPGLVPPLYDITIPPGISRPTSNDIVINSGFDGRTPAQAVEVIVKQLTNPLAEQNRGLVVDTATRVHRAFTVAVSNAFIPGSPFQRLAAAYPGAKLTMMATMSVVQPVIIRIDQPGKDPIFMQRGGGGYEPTTEQPYQVVMQTPIRLSPPGVQISYPKWTVPALAGEIGRIVEL